MHRIDGPGATPEGLFTDGNPLTGTPATVVLAKWLNNLQEEVISVLTAGGLTPDQNSITQLRDAIIAIATGGGEAITADAVPIADAGNYYIGVQVEAALQEIGAALANSLIEAKRIRRSIVALSGTANSIASTHFENIVEINSASETTYTVSPDATLTAPTGTSITLFQDGAGKIAIAAGAGVTLRTPSGFNAKSYSQNSAVVIVKVAANTWRVGGTLEAAA